MPLLTGDSRLELGGCVHDAVEAYNNVDKWAKTERAPWSLNFSLVGPKIRKEPKGTVLIIRYGDIDSFPLYCLANSDATAHSTILYGCVSALW